MVDGVLEEMRLGMEVNIPGVIKEKDREFPDAK